MSSSHTRTVSSRRRGDDFAAALESVLSTNGERVSIQTCDVSPGCPAGENFVGEILRVRLAGRRRARDGSEEGLDESYIMKRIPRAGAVNHRFFDCRRMFDNEAIAYEVVLPRLYDLARKATRRGTRAACFAEYRGRADDFMILQDLNALGYQMGNRSRGFDVEECSLVLDTLASFHALSLSLKASDPEAFREISSAVTESVFREESARGLLGECWVNGIKSAIRSLEEGADPALDPAIATLASYLDSDMLGLADVVRGEPPFDVICHGDLWTNNILLRRGDDAEVRFVDLQNFRHASCALDVMHLLFTSLRVDSLGDNFEGLVSRYYDSLAESMADLGRTPEFTASDLRDEIRTRSRYGVCVACILLTVVTKPATRSEADEELTAEDEIRGTRMNNVYHERLRNLVTALMTLRVI